MITVSPSIDKLLADLPKDLTDRIKESGPLLNAMLSSEGFKLWDEWSGAIEEGLKQNALIADTLEEREEARNEWLAMKKMRYVPVMLHQMAQGPVTPSENAPADLP